jgi:IMP dehydrogenase/GMP reductase
MSIEAHLKKYFDVPNKQDVAELVLDGVQVAEIKESEKKVLEQYSGTLVLSMNNCGLKSLNNLPKFAELEIVKEKDLIIK